MEAVMAAPKAGDATLTLEEYQAAQEAEWGQYVATQPIFIDGVRAFNAGDPVPAGHVKRDLVAKSQVTAAEKKDA
jgi:hypothetical protein